MNYSETISNIYLTIYLRVSINRFILWLVILGMMFLFGIIQDTLIDYYGSKDHPIIGSIVAPICEEIVKGCIAFSLIYCAFSIGYLNKWIPPLNENKSAAVCSFFLAGLFFAVHEQLDFNEPYHYFILRIMSHGSMTMMTGIALAYFSTETPSFIGLFCAISFHNFFNTLQIIGDYRIIIILLSFAISLIWNLTLWRIDRR